MPLCPLTSPRLSSPPACCPCLHHHHHAQGFPWAEPGFATICELDTAPAAAATQHDGGDDLSSWRQHTLTDGTPCLHAVLHRVTQQEWASIKASEGVFGSGQSSSVGYQVGERQAAGWGGGLKSCVTLVHPCSCLHVVGSSLTTPTLSALLPVAACRWLRWTVCCTTTKQSSRLSLCRQQRLPCTAQPAQSAPQHGTCACYKKVGQQKKQCVGV